MGTARGRTGKHWDHHGWVMEITTRSLENDGLPAHDLVPLALKGFETKVKPLAKLVSSLGDAAQRYIVLAILATEIPGIELSQSFLQLLADLGGTFQVDLST
jgi:hypothetical protein